jgi:hypothetical protein
MIQVRGYCESTCISWRRYSQTCLTSIYNKSLSIKNSIIFSMQCIVHIRLNLYTTNNCSQRARFDVTFSALYIQVWLYFVLLSFRLKSILLSISKSSVIYNWYVARITDFKFQRIDINLWSANNKHFAFYLF